AGSPPDCSSGGSSVPPTNVAVTPGTTTSGTAVSGNFTPTAAGTYCWRAEFTPAPTSFYSPGEHTDQIVGSQCFTVGKNNPALTTQLKLTSNDQNIGSSIPIGTSIYDTASLASSFQASGTITYKIYSNATCTTLVADVTPSPNTVTNGVIPN